MKLSLLKATTSVCVALVLAQPVPTAVWAAGQGQDCGDQKDCAPRGKPEQKRPPQQQQKREQHQPQQQGARPGQGQDHRAEPKPQERKPAEPRPQGQELRKPEPQQRQPMMPAPNQGARKPDQRPDQQRTDQQRRDQQRPDQQRRDQNRADQMRNGGGQTAPAQNAQPPKFLVAPGAQQPQQQPQMAKPEAAPQGQMPRQPDARPPQNRDQQQSRDQNRLSPAPQGQVQGDQTRRDATAPDQQRRDQTNRGDQSRPGQPPVPLQPGVGQARPAPGGADQLNRPQPDRIQQQAGGQRPDQARPDRRPPPQAAEVRGNPFAGQQGQNDQRRFRVSREDVRRPSENQYHRDGNRDRNGLTDLQKFGLVALGAAAVGAILSNGNRVVQNSGDRVVVQTQRGYRVYHDDDVLLRRPGSEIVTRRYDDGSVLTKLTQPDGTVILTVRSADGRALRRIVRYPHRTQPVVLFDDTQPVSTPDFQDLPPQSSVAVVYGGNTDPGLLRSALMARPDVRAGEYYSLNQIRNYAELRYLAPEIDVAALNFPSGSSAINDAQAARLAVLGRTMADVVRDNPDALFLVEGHSDAVGDAVTNLALSDARAEAMAQVLTEQYGVPPQNIITQGYGETDLKHQTDGPDEVNRRIIIRPISGLLAPPAPVDHYSDQVWDQ